jgi:hypothetical protein
MFSKTALSLLAALTFAVTGPVVAGAQTDDEAPFSVSAVAAPVALQVADTGTPVVPGELLYITPSFSRAEFDSLENSAGLAAAPWFGDAAPALMGTFNAVSPTGPVFPAYPFSAASQFPGNGKASASNGPFSVESMSGETGTRATAKAGAAHGNPGLVSSVALSAAEQAEDGLLTAVAESTVVGLSLGPALTIPRVAGAAKVTGRAGEEVSKESSFSLGSLIVNGTVVGLTDKGLVPVSETNPGADMAALTKGLEQAGITLALLPARQTATSIDSGALEVIITRDVPNHGLVTVKLILGRVRAEIGS